MAELFTFCAMVGGHAHNSAWVSYPRRGPRVRVMRGAIRLGQDEGGLARAKFRVWERQGFFFTFARAAYDLVRLPKLLGTLPSMPRPRHCDFVMTLSRVSDRCLCHAGHSCGRVRIGNIGTAILARLP
jgi:hypothetical protein